MELPPGTAQQSAVSGLLDKRVFEQVLRGGRHAALKDQAGIDEALKRFLERFFSEFTDRSCQLVGKLATDRGADLGNPLYCRAEPVQRHHCHMRLTGPGRPELRTEGGGRQDWQGVDSRENEV